MERKAATWEQAKAYFEIGKSLTFISDTLDLDKSTISKRAKREGWIKGEVQRLTDDSVRIKSEIFNLVQPLRSIVESDIDERTKHLALINNATHTNINRMMKKFNPKSREYIPDMDVMEHKAVQSTIKDARESLLGKELPPTPTPEEQRAIDIGRDDIKKTLKVIQGKFNSLGVDVT